MIKSFDSRFKKTRCCIARGSEIFVLEFSPFNTDISLSVFLDHKKKKLRVLYLYAHVVDKAACRYML